MLYAVPPEIEHLLDLGFLRQVGLDLAAMPKDSDAACSSIRMYLDQVFGHYRPTHQHPPAYTHYRAGSESYTLVWRNEEAWLANGRIDMSQVCGYEHVSSVGDLKFLPRRR